MSSRLESSHESGSPVDTLTRTGEQWPAMVKDLLKVALFAAVAAMVIVIIVGGFLLWAGVGT